MYTGETETMKKVKAQNEAKRLAVELESERAAHEATKRERDAMREALQKLDTITCDCGHIFAEHSFSADSVGCDIPHCKCGRSIVEVIEKRFKSIFAASPAPQAQAVTDSEGGA